MPDIIKRLNELQTKFNQGTISSDEWDTELRGMKSIVKTEREALGYYYACLDCASAIIMGC